MAGDDTFRRMKLLGDLSCHLVESDREAELAVVLCHGFGACGDDLVPLADALRRSHPAIRERVRFVFPEAPLELGDMGWGTARAWWMIDFARRQLEGPERFRVSEPEGLPEARRLLEGALESLGMSMSRVFLGGFSQGAMLTTDLALRAADPPAGLAILSGALIHEPAWSRLAPARAGLPVIQSHGRQDPVLPYEGAIALRDLLAGAGLAPSFLPFEGEHEIPPEAVRALAAAIAARV